MPKPITFEEAQSKYQIKCEHSQMDNGELRFRLLADRDSTAYIRTESSAAGGWQNAHYHEHVLETYIVQDGWIALCELVGDVYEYTKYVENESFITRPLVVHNVYMSAGAVIHTVKHGASSGTVGSDRVGDAPAPKQMTADNARVSEPDLLRIARPAASRLPLVSSQGLAISQTPKTEAERLYGAEYRHFDNLIWQIPTWSFAILTVAFFAAANIKADGAFAKYLSLQSSERIFAVTFGSFGLFLALLSYALYRFRWHQAGVTTAAPRRKFLKTQAALQLFVSIESLALLLLALRGVPSPTYSDVPGALAVLVLTLLVPFAHYALETSIDKRARSTNRTFPPS